ncbi:hypothetical protein DH2020_020867 [Rehmannia glutinosa]|uniref:NAC domain-containing protein n=1 Tax=Rehmannia glutinosa TaxID=99300 RepID=A0ABR0W8R0_REHGL
MDHQHNQQINDQAYLRWAGLAPGVRPYPPGFRFVPKDEELIKDYLQKRINNEPIPLFEISDVVLYEHHPQYLAENYPKLGEDEWYFFTPRDRKYKMGKRPKRSVLPREGTTGCRGYWKATGADKQIEFEGENIGKRKALVFYEGEPKPNKSTKTNWIMHEYRINKTESHLRTSLDDMRLDDWVLCRIYEKAERTNKKAERTNRKRKRDVDNHDPDEDDNDNDNVADNNVVVDVADDNVVVDVADDNVAENNDEEDLSRYLQDNNDDQHYDHEQINNGFGYNGNQFPAYNQVFPNSTGAELSQVNNGFGDNGNQFPAYNQECINQVLPNSTGADLSRVNNGFGDNGNQFPAYNQEYINQVLPNSTGADLSQVNNGFGDNGNQFPAYNQVLPNSTGANFSQECQQLQQLEIREGDFQPHSWGMENDHVTNHDDFLGMDNFGDDMFKFDDFYGDGVKPDFNPLELNELGGEVGGQETELNESGTVVVGQDVVGGLKTELNESGKVVGGRGLLED